MKRFAATLAVTAALAVSAIAPAAAGDTGQFPGYPDWAQSAFAPKGN